MARYVIYLQSKTTAPLYIVRFSGDYPHWPIGSWSGKVHNRSINVKNQTNSLLVTSE